METEWGDQNINKSDGENNFIVYQNIYIFTSNFYYKHKIFVFHMTSFNFYIKIVFVESKFIPSN